MKVTATSKGGIVIPLTKNATGDEPVSAVERVSRETEACGLQRARKFKTDFANLVEEMQRGNGSSVYLYKFGRVFSQETIKRDLLICQWQFERMTGGWKE